MGKTAGSTAQPLEIRVADALEHAGIGLGRGGAQRWLQLLQPRLVADFEDAQGLVHREPVPGRVGDRLVVREHGDQAIGIPGLGSKDDAAPEVVDANCADAVVLGMLELLQVDAGMGVPGELAHRGLDGTPNWFVQFCVLCEEVFRDGEPRQSRLLSQRADEVP